ncbi:hypothetical protein PMKS-003562 [Pichia membranifaciens]|uniref:Uncharacterized protein n=1 Tax=Pichia membranifaciens TaxID=4926 RepID=A0A1Q2YKH7_9ASCO|nr:hypothetical protein PMKS-003562 [Pichia membranifaciens]
MSVKASRRQCVQGWASPRPETSEEGGPVQLQAGQQPPRGGRDPALPAHEPGRLPFVQQDRRQTEAGGEEAGTARAGRPVPDQARAAAARQALRDGAPSYDEQDQRHREQALCEQPLSSACRCDDGEVPHGAERC